MNFLCRSAPPRAPRRETPHCGRKSDSLVESEDFFDKSGVVSPRFLRADEREKEKKKGKTGYCLSCDALLPTVCGGVYQTACSDADCQPCGHCGEPVLEPCSLRFVLFAQKNASVPWSCLCLITLGWDVNSATSMLTYRIGAFTRYVPVSIPEVTRFIQQWGGNLKPSTLQRLDSIWAARRKPTHRNPIPPETPSLQELMMMM